MRILRHTKKYSNVEHEHRTCTASIWSLFAVAKVFFYLNDETSKYETMCRNGREIGTNSTNREETEAKANVIS